MEIFDILRKRHSVRQFKDEPINTEIKNALRDLVEEINHNHQTNMQLFFDEPEAFNTSMAHYGKFENCENYLALVGQKKDSEKLGFYGEQVYLKACELGLDGCWVALTYGKGKVRINKEKGEKLICVIALGYGKNKGAARKSKTIEEVVKKGTVVPEYALDGIKAMLWAPTAINQQKFEISFEKDTPIIKEKGLGFYTSIDLGIVKYHFEAVTNRKTNRTY